MINYGDKTLEEAYRILLVIRKNIINGKKSVRIKGELNCNIKAIFKNYKYIIKECKNDITVITWDRNINIGLSDDEFLDSEKYWKDNFKVKFIAIKDGTELWKVSNKKKSIHTNSMLKAFKIAYVAMMIQDNKSIELMQNINGSVILNAKLLNYNVE